MTTARKLITADELLAMPRQDGRRYELIRGVLVEKVPTGRPHTIVVNFIAYVLSSFVIPRDYGELHTGEPGYLLEIGPDTVRAPDVAWVAPDRIPGDATGYPNLAPDLAVEVKSPSNSHPELRRKAEMWLSFGCRLVWVVDPDTTTVTVYRPGVDPVALSEGDTIDGGDLLPDFTAPVWSLFRARR